MARAAEPNPRLTATYCPGTMGYMSPEALREPPAYTTKLDIFSCGVLHIQIITRKFPDPGPRLRQIEINDPRVPLGQVEVPVPERERRRSHIDLIDPTHPLLKIALDCLKDKEGERPSAEQLCSRLTTLKEAHSYQESLQQAQQAAQSLHKGTGAQPEPQKELLQQNQELRQQLEEREKTVQAKEREVDGLMKSMEQLRLQSQEKETQIQQKERDNRCLQNQVSQLGDEVRQKHEQVQQLRHELHQTSHDSEQPIATLQHSLEQKDEVIRSMDEVIRSKDAALQEKQRPIQELRQSQGDKRGSSTAAQPLRLQWRSGPKAPVKTFGESSVHGEDACFYSWDENKIMMYNSETEKWAILPECPKRSFSLAVVNGLLTAIGGQTGWLRLKNTKTLLSLTEQQKWTEQFPTMTYYHNHPAVTCTSTSLIVAGGGGPDEAWAPVEVMDTSTLCWSTAASLPHPWQHATATIWGDRIYIAGGIRKGDKTDSVLTGVVSELLQSTATQRQSLRTRPTAASDFQPSIDSHKVWQEAAPLPVYHSSLVALHGRLLAVGGCDSYDNPTSAVYQYDTATNSWKVISHMSTKRWQCFTAVLPDNTLLVAGGCVRDFVVLVSYINSVEIASCM